MFINQGQRVIGQFKECLHETNIYGKYSNYVELMLEAELPFQHIS